MSNDIKISVCVKLTKNVKYCFHNHLAIYTVLYDFNRYTYNTDMLYINNNANVDLEFNEETYDTDDIHSTVSNTERLTVPADVSRIRLTAQARVNPSIAAGRTTLGFSGNITVPGVNFHNTSNFTTASDVTIFLNSAIFTVSEDDWFKVTIVQNSGANIPLEDSWFAMEIIE